MKRAPIKEMPSQEVLNRLFSYNPETGVLIWKRREDTAEGAHVAFCAAVAELRDEFARVA